MKTKKFIIITALLISNVYFDIGFAQDRIELAPEIICGGRTVTYDISSFPYSFTGGPCNASSHFTNSGCTVIDMEWGIFLTVNWPIGFENGVIEFEFNHDPYDCYPDIETFYFFEKRVDSINLTISPPGASYSVNNEVITVTAVIDGQNLDHFGNAVDWSLYYGDTWLMNFPTDDDTLSFRSLDYIDVIKNYYGQGLFIRAEKGCTQANFKTKQITFDKPPASVPYGGYLQEDEICFKESNGKFTLNRIRIDGITYSNQNLPETIRVGYRRLNIQGIAPVEEYINSVPFTSDNDFYPNTYYFTVERSIDNGNSYGIISDEYEFTISPAAKINASSQVTEPITCYGGSGTITATASGGKGVLSFSTDNSNWFNATSINGNNYIYARSGLTEGVHTFYIQDENGCPASSSEITLGEPELISIINMDDASDDFSSMIDPEHCQPADGGISIQATDGEIDGYASFELFRYIESGQDISVLNSGSINTGENCETTFDPLSGGTYYVVVTDGCNDESTSEHITLETLAVPNIILTSVDSAKCHNGQGDITLTGFSYETNNYSSSYTTGINDYIIRLQQDNNTPIEFNNMTLPYSIKEDGANSTLVGNTNWNLSVEHVGTGCVSIPSPLYINHPDELTVNKEIIPVLCQNSGDITLTANVDGGTEPYTYVWEKEGEIVNVPNTFSSIEVWEGKYDLKVVDGNNCGYGKTVPDGSYFPIVFSAIRPQILDIYTENITDIDRIGENNGSVSLGTNFSESFFEFSDDGVNFQNSPEFNGLSKGDHTFYIRNKNGCINSIVVPIGEAPLFTTSLKSSTNVKCYNDYTGQIEITAKGGVKPYRFEITGSLGIPIEQTDSVFSGLKADTYAVKVYYNSYEFNLNDVTITQPSAELQASITAQGDAVCGQQVGWATVTATGGTPIYSYFWDTNNQTTATATGLSADIHSVLVTDANGCKTSITAVLSDPAGPQLTQVSSTPAPCFDSENGGSATLSVSGGKTPYDISWKDINTTGLTASNIAPGTYTATVTDADNCPFTLNNITVPSPSELLINFDDFKDPVCFDDQNGELSVSATGGTAPYSFAWDNHPEADNTGFINNLPAGRFTVQLSDANNCNASESITLLNPDEIIIDLADSVFLCTGQTATLNAGNPGMFYQWTSNTGFESQNREVELQDEGDYTITVSNTNACSSSKKLHIKYENRLLEGGFLLSSQGTMSDTIVLIEISWPVPDSVQWTIPDDFIRQVDGENYKELIPLQTGEYTISMKAYLSGCSDMIEKQITIVPGEDIQTKKEQIQEIITKAKLFPNPNSGVFEIKIELSQESDIQIDLFSMKGMKIIPTKYETGKKDYLVGFNLMKLDPGIYFINIIAQNEMKKLKFIVN